MHSLQDLFALRDENLKTLSEKIVYLLIKEESKGQDWAALKMKTLSDDLGMTIQGVFKVIQKLKACGLIEQKQEKKRQNSVNEYRLKEK